MRIYINICMYIYVILFIEDIGQHVNSDYFWEVGLQVILLIILILMLLCISNFLQWAHIIIYFLSCVLFLKSEKKVEVLENLLLPRSGSGANTWGQTLNCCGWSLVRGSAVLGLWGARGPGAQTWSWFVQEFTVLTLALVTSLLVSTKRTSQVSSREKGRSRRERYLRSTLTDWSVSTGHPGWESERQEGEGECGCFWEDFPCALYLSTEALGSGRGAARLLCGTKAAFCPSFSQMRSVKGP